MPESIRPETETARSAEIKRSRGVGCIYLPFFGLEKHPFSGTPDPRFFLKSQTHLDALAAMIYGIRDRKGFLLLTGPVGTGKTMILRTLLEYIDPSVAFSHVINTDVNFLELLQMICLDFRLPIRGKSKIELINDLFEFLVDNRLMGRTALVLVDEAQNLKTEVLEALRMLSNLETPREKLLQILLCGQPEIKEKLSQGSLRQLGQRIEVYCELQPLKKKEVERYIYHRLRVSGVDGEQIFAPGIAEQIAALTDGIPRLVNIICDAALRIAYANMTKVVDDGILMQAAEQCLYLVSRGKVPMPAAGMSAATNLPWESKGDESAQAAAEGEKTNGTGLKGGEGAGRPKRPSFFKRIASFVVLLCAVLLLLNTGALSCRQHPPDGGPHLPGGGKGGPGLWRAEPSCWTTSAGSCPGGADRFINRALGWEAG